MSPAQDTSPIKEKILLTLRTRGPSLPVHLAKESEQSILFASAFLSELLSEQKLKISNMKIGSSPIYYLKGQESKLANFSHHLKSKEKEAYELLKQKTFLKDKEQQPAIRVALRAIKDFAFPFEDNNEVVWRYFTISESEFNKQNKPKPIEEKPKPVETKPKPILIEPKKIVEPNIPKKELDIFDKPKEEKPIKLIKKKTKNSQKKDEKFFNKVKESLIEKSFEILDIENFNKSELILKIKKNEKQFLLIAHNKKRADEKDIIKAHKKSQEYQMPFIILTLGEQTKKLNEFTNAIKNMHSIEKL